MHRHTVHLLLAGLTCVALAPAPSRAEEAAKGVVVETADGTIIPGTLPAGLELVLLDPHGPTTIVAARIDRLAVSSVSEQEERELEAAVQGIAERWQRDEWAVREAAMEEALKLPGAAAPLLARLRTHQDAEVVTRAEAVLEALKARSQLLDPRDLVVVDKKVLRGRLALEKLELATALGPVEVPLRDIRTLRREDVPARTPAAQEENEWPPPLVTIPERKPADGNIAVVVFLRGGWRLVGECPPDALHLVDEKGGKVPTDRLLRIDRDKAAPEFVRVSRGGAVPVRARIDAKEIEVDSAARKWSVPAEMVDQIVVGGLRHSGGIEQLVASFLQAAAAGETRPEQRFWVQINDQRANPWNSVGKKGMTWTLIDVKGDACLVGTDDKSNAYNGDTDIETELPILALRPANHAPPEDLDVTNEYRGWSSGEIRLTRPVKGSELKSLDDANALIESEFGKGWRMAEFHDSSTGGWHWWAYWVEQGAGGK